MNTNEKYVLFLRADRRKTALRNTNAVAPLVPIGVWSGKAQIVNGRIKFLPSVLPGLRAHNDRDATEFIELVKKRIRVIFRHRKGSFG